METSLIVIGIILILAYLEMTESYKTIYKFIHKQVKDILPILKISIISIVGSSILVLIVRGLS